MRLKLTNETLRTKCLPPAPGESTASGRALTQKIYWDTDLRGFGVLVGAQSKAFIVQRDVAGRTLRRKIGRFPTWTVEQARKQAREVIVKLDKGEDPLEEARHAAEQQRRQEWQRFTLRQAMANHIENMRAKGCADRTPVQLTDELVRLAGDWMERPLVHLRRKDCIERHRKITTDNGPYVANRVMRTLRAIWNSASRLYEDLPPHPVIGVVFNKERRRREPIPWAQLPAWWQKVRRLPNPVRRDLNLMILFTGLRMTDACTVRWEHIDFAAGTLHRPKPKGGKDRAFTVPLAAFMLRLLERRLAQSPLLFPEGDNGWVFPTRDRQGAVVPVREAKEQRFVYLPDGGVKKSFYLPTPHRLRDTFATACLESGIGQTETKILLNHSLPNDDVTSGYQKPSIEHLRVGVEKVAIFLLKAKRAAKPEPAARKVRA